MKNFFTNFKGDALGGITAGIVALPLALAFGVSSGMGPSAGLYGAIFLSFFATLFGGTPTQISGPTTPMTAVSMVVIAGIIGVNNGNLEQALPYILLVFLLSGIMQVGLGVASLGKYIKYIPYPVVSGFMTAIGVIVLITQILPVIGYDVKNDEVLIKQNIPIAEEHILEKILIDESKEGLLVLEDFKETILRAEKITKEQIELEATNMAKKSSSGVMGTLRTIPRALPFFNFIEFAMALATIIIIYGFKRITKVVPSRLVALLVVSGVAILGQLDYRPIQAIPEGFPSLNIEIFSAFELNTILPYIGTALTLALLGAIDSLLTSVVADNLTKTKHAPNKELIGQGVGNSMAALFGGIPGAGATIRTVVNIQSGGKTKLSGMIASLVLLAILLVLSPLASKIPAAVLAGILVTVGIGVMDFKGLKAIPKIPASEIIIMVTVLVLSVFWNLVYAVGIGLVMASLFFMKKMGDISNQYSKIAPVIKEKKWKDEEQLDNAFLEKIFIKHLSGPLFFGFTSDFQNLFKQLPRTARVVIFRMDRVPYIDQSGLYAMEDALIELSQKNIVPLMVGIENQPRFLMNSIGLIGPLIPEDHIFKSFQACREWVIQNNGKWT